MYMGRIDADMTVSAAGQVAEAPRGNFWIGVLILAVALPYGIARLVGSLLWRDIVRIVRVVRMCGGAYADAFSRR